MRTLVLCSKCFWLRLIFCWIVLTTETGQGKSSTGQKYGLHAAEDMVWPDGVVFYVLDESYEPREKAIIQEAMTSISNETSIDGQPIVFFKERDRHRDYIYIHKHPTKCSSTVGCEGGRQRVVLGVPCLEKSGRMQHELLHTLGFFHEQQRPDRDSFVRIMWDNIKLGKYHDFMRLNPRSKMHPDLPYDYASVLHYPRHAFSVKPKSASIVTRHKEKIGQRMKMSNLDVKRVQLLYGGATLDRND